MRKIGRIKTTHQFLNDLEILNLLYTKITPYRILPDNGTILSPVWTIHAYSDEFEEVKVGDYIPTYEVTFVRNGETYTVTISKCEKQEYGQEDNASLQEISERVNKQIKGMT